MLIFLSLGEGGTIGFPSHTELSESPNPSLSLAMENECTVPSLTFKVIEGCSVLDYGNFSSFTFWELLQSNNGEGPKLSQLPDVTRRRRTHIPIRSSHILKNISVRSHL